jgi:hypothetical protein
VTQPPNGEGEIQGAPHLAPLPAGGGRGEPLKKYLELQTQESLSHQI